MTIECRCECGKEFRLDPKFAGKKIRCLACRQVLTVPEDVEIAVELEPLDEELESTDSGPNDADDALASAFAETGGVVRSSDGGRAVVGQLGTVKLREPAGCLGFGGGVRWAAAGIGNDIQIIDMKSHQRAFKIEVHESDVTAVEIAPNDTQVLSGDARGRLMLWDLERRKGLRWIKGHKSAICSIAISPDSRYGVTAAESRDVRLWDLESGVELTLHESDWDTAIKCVRFSPDGRMIAACGGGGQVDVWDVVSGEPIRQLRGASGTLGSLAFSANSDSLTSCAIGYWSGKCKVWQWKLPSGKAISCWENPSKPDCINLYNSVVPGGTHLVSIGQLPNDRPSDRAAMSGTTLGAGISSISLGIDLFDAIQGNTSLGDPYQFRFQAWNVRTGHRTQNFLFRNRQRNDMPIEIVASANGQRALVATKRQHVQIWGLG